MFELETLQAFKDIKANGPMDRLYGLCLNLDWQMSKIAADWDQLQRGQARYHALKWMAKITNEWPMNDHTSGCFPVPAPKGSELSNSMAYMLTPDKWDQSTEYGNNRWALVDYAIEYMQRVIDAS